jgi:hypothetical protein
MAKGKEMSSKGTSFAKGGSTKMFGKQSAGTQVPGQTASMGRNGKIAQGGGKKMAGKGAARPAKAGATVSN